MLGWSDAPDAPMKAREKGTVTRKLIVPVMSSVLAQRVGHPVPVFQLAYFAAVNCGIFVSCHLSIRASEHPSMCGTVASALRLRAVTDCGAERIFAPSKWPDSSASPPRNAFDPLRLRNVRAEQKMAFMI